MEHYFTNNQDLKSEFRNIVYKINGITLNFTSDLGVFSKDKVDFASNLLITTYINKGRKNIKLLDLGCGYGIIGITLNKIMNTSSTLVDVNKRAVHLANMNIKNMELDCKAYESDIYSSVTELYDVIITNPPIRAGKDVVKTFLRDAKNHLNKDGELWFVMNKDHGAKSMMEYLKEYYNLEIMDRDKGFFVVKCKCK